MLGQLSGLFWSFRPNQWVKNLVVLIPLFFAGQLLNPDLFRLALAGALLFILASSAAYLINDLFDLPLDRKLPVGLKRPIARGRVSTRLVAFAIVLLVFGAISISFKLEPKFGLVILGYLILNILYSAGLKQLAPLDVFIVALGFVLRVIGGKVLTDLPSSPWLFLGTFFIALLLVLSKRFVEARLFLGRAVEKRRAIGLYQPELLKSWLNIAVAAVLVVYALYSIDSEVVAASARSDLFVYSIVFVTFGLFRYLQLLYQGEEAGFLGPLKRDPASWLNGLFWLGYTGFILYF